MTLGQYSASESDDHADQEVDIGGKIDLHTLHEIIFIKIGPWLLFQSR